MATNNFTRQQTRTRLALMNAAVKLIIADGYDKLTITAIADEADYTRRAFYLHFKSTEDIVQVILVEWYQKIQVELMKHIHQLEYPMREYALWNKGLEILYQNIAFLKQMPDLLTHELGAPVREEIRKAILDNIMNREVQFRDGITPNLLIKMEINMMGLLIDTLKTTSDITQAQQIIDDHFRILFNQEPPDPNN